VHIVSKEESTIKILTDVLDKHVDEHKKHETFDIVFPMKTPLNEKDFKSSLSCVDTHYTVNTNVEAGMAACANTSTISCSTQLKNTTFQVTQFSAPLKDHERHFCVICMEDITGDNFKVLSKCKHVFHRTCIEKQFEHKAVCPTCNVVYGIIHGDQPENGTMVVLRNPPQVFQIIRKPVSL